MPNISSAAPAANIDIASSAITATATTSAFVPAVGNGYRATITVTASSGSSPTMDVVVQESDDGTNWYDVYHFERITTTGVYRSPSIVMTGSMIRYVQTIGGSSPSFTRQVMRSELSFPADMTQRRFINRSMAPNTLNSNTGSFRIDGCDTIEALVWMSVVGTGGFVQLQASDDGTNWFGLTSATAMASAVRLSAPATSGYSYQFVRVAVTTAATGATLDHVVIKGWKG